MKQEIENEGERDDEAGEEGKLHGEHEGLGRLERAHQAEIALGIKIGGGTTLEKFQGKSANFLPFIGEGFDKGLSFFLLQLIGGAIDDGGFGDGAGAIIPDFLPPMLGERGVELAERRRDFGEAECCFPVFERDAEIFGESGFMFVDPDLFDRFSDDLHQLVFVNEAGEGRDQQGDRDSRDHNSQVFQVVEEGLFLIRIGFIPELEHFGEKKHVAGS